MGVPEIQRITITATEKTGTSIFRAVQVRPWKFNGFDNFKSTDIDPASFVDFHIQVLDRSLKTDILNRKAAVEGGKKLPHDNHDSHDIADELEPDEL